MLHLPPTAALLLLLASGCGGPTGYRGPAVFRGQTMGTAYMVKISAQPKRLTRQQIQSSIDEALSRVDLLMSTYKADSEVSRFNRHDREDWFPISSETAMVIGESLEISRLTDGAFDITVGPLVDLWNFGPERSDVPELPPAEEIQRLQASTGCQLLDLRLDPPAVRKTDPHVRIDLSAVAKGYAVDRVAEVLTQLGIPGFMVEVGGEVRTAGRKADGGEWVVGVELPDGGHRGVVLRSVPLNDASLATSGDYRNFHLIDNQRYSHTIDPRTGRPVTHSLASVSVVDSRCARADALATALLVMGPDKAFEFAERHDFNVLLVTRADDEYKELATRGFLKLYPPQTTTP